MCREVSTVDAHTFLDSSIMQSDRGSTIHAEQFHLQRGQLMCKILGFIFYVLSQPHKVDSKLQALVYDILPSTTAVFSYAIGSRKLSANELFFVLSFCCWCSNSSKFVTNNSNYIRCLFYNSPC